MPEKKKWSHIEFICINICFLLRLFSWNVLRLSISIIVRQFLLYRTHNEHCVVACGVGASFYLLYLLPFDRNYRYETINDNKLNGTGEKKKSSGGYHMIYEFVFLLFWMVVCGMWVCHCHSYEVRRCGNQLILWYEIVFFYGCNTFCALNCVTANGPFEWVRMTAAGVTHAKTAIKRVIDEIVDG